MKTALKLDEKYFFGVKFIFETIRERANMIMSTYLPETLSKINSKKKSISNLNFGISGPLDPFSE